MTYNPRIRNKKNNRLQVTGSVLTGSVADFNVVSGSTFTGSLYKGITADFNIVSGSTISGSTAYLSTLTVDTINISNTINTTASYALTAAYAESALTASYALTASVADNATTASFASSALTASYALTASVANNAATASFASNADTLDGLDSTVFVQSANLANLAVTSITAGVGLNASDSTGSITLDVDVTEIVTITGSQQISGQKSFTSNLSGTTAQFTELTASNIVVGNISSSAATFSGSILVYGTASLSQNPTAAYLLYSASLDKIVVYPGLYVSGATSLSTISGTTAQFTSVTASFVGDLQGTASYATNAGNAATVTNGVYTTNISSYAVTSVAAGNGLTGGGTVGALTLNVSGGNGITVSTDEVAVDFAVVAGLSGSTFTGPITGTTAYFSGDVVINGTASIGQLNTLSQQSLVVGDKYITILSGAADHTSLDGSGFLWGSGSTGPTVNELGANAHLRYRNSRDALEVFPGLYVSGATEVSTISGTVAQFTTLTASLVALTNVNSGLVSADALATNVTGVNANFDLAALGNKHTILVDAGASDITGTLPAAAATPYRQYIFKKIDATENAMSIVPSGSETIDGENKIDVVAQYETVSIVSDGVSKWYIV